MLAHKDLTHELAELTLLHFGVDKVWWRKLNKPFYPNRTPHELIIGGYLLKYKKHRGCAYVVEVIKNNIHGNSSAI